MNAEKLNELFNNLGFSLESVQCAFEDHDAYDILNHMKKVDNEALEELIVNGEVFESIFHLFIAKYPEFRNEYKETILGHEVKA